MALKDIYEMNNVSVGDPSKTDKFVLMPPEGQVDFPSRDIKIPTSLKNFETIVIDNPTKKVGPGALDDIDL